ncbi:MAG: ketopantoate reductase family protein [Rudaea sp.]
MGSKCSILVFGASYGSLLAVKLLGAGHDVTLVCRPETAQLINDEGVRVRMPGAARGEVVEVDSRRLPGCLSATAPADIDCADYDLVVLAMQEPQYRAAELRNALAKVARAKLPCMSIMNMPPLPYLARVPGLDIAPLRHAYSDPTVWDDFDPARMTLCSPDPQAFRPPGERPNVLQVRLATNFKTATFASDDHNAILDALQRDVESARFPIGDQSVTLPVKLKVHDSLHVPFAKWSMLLAGNYRCVQSHGMRSISDAIHGEPETAREVYEWVASVCKQLGARDEDLVPFDKYAAAATSLTAPSSAARALAAGTIHIERVDRLVQSIAANLGMRLDEVDRTVEVVDAWVASNRRREDERSGMPERAAT